MLIFFQDNFFNIYTSAILLQKILYSATNRRNAILGSSSRWHISLQRLLYCLKNSYQNLFFKLQNRSCALRECKILRKIMIS